MPVVFFANPAEHREYGRCVLQQVILVLGGVDAGGQLQRVVLAVEPIHRLEVLHEVVSLANELLLVHFLEVDKLVELLPQVGAKVPEDGSAVYELKLLALILIGHFAGALLFRTALADGDAAVHAQAGVVERIFDLLGVDRELLHFIVEVGAALQFVVVILEVTVFRDYFFDDFLDRHVVRLGLVQRSGDLALLGIHRGRHHIQDQ